MKTFSFIFRQGSVNKARSKAKVATLTQQCGRAIGIRFIGSFLDVILTVFTGIILARILSPEEFGLFGIALSIGVVSQKFGSCGMLQALVQRKDLTTKHETAAATFQFGSAALISSLLFLAAPATSKLFGMAGLTVLIRLQAGVLLLDALALIPESRLTRQLAFDRLTAIHLLSRAMATGLTIFLAMRGLGAMALAIGNMTAVIVQTALLWACAPGFLPMTFQLRHLRDLLNYGSGILLINIANLLAQRLDVFIIGQQLGSEAVGLYQRAYQLVLLPLGQMTGPVHKVLFPAMSSVQHQQQRFKTAYLGVVRFSSLLTLPLLTAIWATADVIVPFVYGPMWEGTVPILLILAPTGIFRILLNTNGIVTQAYGRVMAEAVQQGIWLILVLIFALVGSRAGVLGVTIGVTLATIIFFVNMTRLTLTILDLRFSVWLKTIQTGIYISAIMGLSILLVKYLFRGHLSNLPLLTLTACSGVLIYVIALRSCINRADSDLLELICRILPSPLRRLVRSSLGINLPIPIPNNMST